MMKVELHRITAALRNMTPEQRKLVAAELALLERQSAATVIVEGRFSAMTRCPHCKTERVTRHGHANGLQCYRCLGCGRTFGAMTGTPLWDLHNRSKWLGHAEALRDGRTMDCLFMAMNMRTLSSVEAVLGEGLGPLH